LKIVERFSRNPAALWREPLTMCSEFWNSANSHHRIKLSNHLIEDLHFIFKHPSPKLRLPLSVQLFDRSPLLLNPCGVLQIMKSFPVDVIQFFEVINALMRERTRVLSAEEFFLKLFST
jgi:hypothetical protein